MTDRRAFMTPEELLEHQRFMELDQLLEARDRLAGKVAALESHLRDAKQAFDDATAAIEAFGYTQPKTVDDITTAGTVYAQPAQAAADGGN